MTSAQSVSACFQIERDSFGVIFCFGVTCVTKKEMIQDIVTTFNFKLPSCKFMVLIDLG